MLKPLAALALLGLATSLLADAVRLKSGEILRGRLVDTQAGFVRLDLPENEGQALRRLAPAAIDSLKFEDPEDSLETQALRRAQFLPLLSENDARILPSYLEHLLTSKQALTTLSYAKLWHPKNNYSALDPIYRSLLIRSSLSVQLPNEAYIHARNWTRIMPRPIEHALPWQVVAQHHLDSSNPEAALWAALTPIAHGSSRNQTNLEPLHNIAAEAYSQLGYAENAKFHLSPQETTPTAATPSTPPPSLLSNPLTFAQLLKTLPQP